MVFQDKTPAVPRGCNSWGWCPSSLPFLPPLFLQALGCLGISDKFVIEALQQVVSLGLHGTHERRIQGLRYVEHGHRGTDKARQGARMLGWMQ